MARRSRSRRSMKKRAHSKKRRAQRGGRRSDYSMKSSLSQGQEFEAAHRLQHGGAAPVGDYGMLPDALRASARVDVLDTAVRQAEAYGNPPITQTGGRRKTRKSSRKGSRKASRKNRKGSRKESRKNRKGSRKNRKGGCGLRKQSGGAVLTGAPYGGSTMLLSPFQAMKAGTADFSDPFARGH
jgi:hypothetical protein